jgi:glutamyl-tRNA reductase
MVIGEPQILGQMKQFFALAQQHRSIGFILNSVMERAFMVAKKVRRETLIASNAVSISSVAVELATKIFGRLDGKTALIVGAGKMSVQSIRHLQSRGVKLVLVTNRTFQSKDALFHLKAWSIASLRLTSLSAQPVQQTLLSEKMTSFAPWQSGKINQFS